MYFRFLWLAILMGLQLVSGCNQTEPYIVEQVIDTGAVKILQSGRESSYTFDFDKKMYAVASSRKLVIPKGAISIVSLANESYAVKIGRGQRATVSIYHDSGKKLNIPKKSFDLAKSSRGDLWIAFELEEPIEDCGQAFAVAFFSGAEHSEVDNSTWTSEVFCSNTGQQIVFCKSGCPVVFKDGMPKAVLRTDGSGFRWQQIALEIPPEFLYLDEPVTELNTEIDIDEEGKYLAIAQAGESQVSSIVWNCNSGSVVFKSSSRRSPGFLSDCFFSDVTAVFAFGRSIIQFNCKNEHLSIKEIASTSPFLRLFKVDSEFAHVLSSKTNGAGFLGIEPLILQ